MIFQGESAEIVRRRARERALPAPFTQPAVQVAIRPVSGGVRTTVIVWAAALLAEITPLFAGIAPQHLVAPLLALAILTFYAVPTFIVFRDAETPSDVDPS